MNIACVVLAAGLGKRMNSPLPKVLHELNGSVMLQHVLNTLKELKPQKITVVVGKHFEKIKGSIKDAIKVSFAHQEEAKGTADALLRARQFLRGFKGIVLVVNGDTPLIVGETLKKLLSLHRRKKDVISIVSFIAKDPGSYGRIVRDERGNVLSIIEDRDATEPQKMIREVNSGIYAMESDALTLLKEIKLNESKGEFYLTDMVSIAKSRGMKVGAYCIGSGEELLGVNTPEELERARKLMKERIIRKWTEKGVSFIDPASVYISCDVEIRKGTTIYPNVYLEDNTKVGKGCTIYPNVRIRNSLIGDMAIIMDSTVIEDSIVREGASVGPFARIRPGSEIGRGAKIGNFVEVKKSIIGPGTKASHLTYLGDAKIGRDVNIGAGTITCNYDGFKKEVTVIDDNAFIGSDSQLIAPVKIGKGAYVGAGSTITKDVPSMSLALSRARQKNIEGWTLRRKLKVKSEKLKVKKGEKR
ncbi:MAG: bifunctional UDP-N-acetylglucosamine diphosphorylase/glucosamine-1-phosphate N-acetyltransferase GlmU [Nitrospirota bacterium]